VEQGFSPAQADQKVPASAAEIFYQGLKPVNNRIMHPAGLKACSTPPHLKTLSDCKLLQNFIEDQRMQAGEHVNIRNYTNSV
jgi:hypothetical protein